MCQATDAFRRTFAPANIRQSGDVVRPAYSYINQPFRQDLGNSVTGLRPPVEIRAGSGAHTPPDPPPGPRGGGPSNPGKRGRPRSASITLAINLIAAGATWRQLPWLVYDEYGAYPTTVQSQLRQRLRRGVLMRQGRDLQKTLTDRQAA